VWKTLAGNMANLKLEEEEEDRVPGFEEVRVRVYAVGLNFADMFACQGLYSATPEGWFIPGLEFSGVIEALHEGAPEVQVSLGSAGRTTSYKVGDRVMGVIRFGGYSTHLITKLHFVRVLPPKWSYDEGASFLCQALTAWFGLREQVRGF
jgi:alcohol dehydrogenase